VAVQIVRDYLGTRANETYQAHPVLVEDTSDILSFGWYFVSEVSTTAKSSITLRVPL